MDNDTLFITFDNEFAQRTVVINKQSQSLSFKGTTFEDMKWMSPFSDLQALYIEDNQLTIRFNSGDSKQIGIIDEACQNLVQQYLQGVLPTTL